MTIRFGVVGQHQRLVPDGADTDDPGDWVVNNIDGAGVPCVPCMAAAKGSTPRPPLTP